MRLPATKKSIFKKTITFLFLFVFFIFSYFVFTKNILATECNETDKDYQTYRPYPGDPCNKKLQNLSLLCGNDMIIKKEFEEIPSGGTCNFSAGTEYTCNYTKTGHIKLSIDPSQSKLPIMGNTELVYNRDNDDEKLDDLTKVNDFVSWYLNGTLKSSNNPYPLYTIDLKKIFQGYDNEIINFSGPINKLLPQEIQNVAKIQQVENAVKSLKATNPDNFIRHDQIVGCTYGLPGPTYLIEQLINTITGLFGREFNIPFSRIATIIGPCNLKNIPAWLEDLAKFLGIKKEHRLSEWKIKNLYPPLRKNYVDSREYFIDYKTWRGESCIVIPFWSFIPKFLRGLGFCFDNPLKPNYYADLFTNIPMSSTEDRKGDLIINKPPDVKSNEMEVEVKNFKLIQPATLNFPHMQESYELSQKLQVTFKPQEGTDNNLGFTEPVDISSNCQILQVRSGDSPGDSLKGKSALAEFDYIASFSCTFSKKDKNPVCRKTMTLNSKIDTNTPLANEVWANLVAGNSSAVRRLFPKFGVDEMGTLIDMPTVTTAEYKGSGASIGPATAEIYFPHIGGIEEYFLKGIQTLLRPKGFGEPIQFGSLSNTSGISGNCSTGTGPCSVENLLSYFGSDIVKATKASIICNKESGSNPNAVNKGCLTGKSVDYSIGLFQINLLAHGNENNVNFDYSWSPISCTMKNPQGIQELETRFLNPIENIKYAVALSRNGTVWSAWSAARACGIQ